MREVTDSWAHLTPYGLEAESIEEIYERLLPNEFVLDEDWAQMRIETTKALMEGQDEVLRKNGDYLAEHRARLEEKLKELQNVHDSLDAEHTKLDNEINQDISDMGVD